jgi:hypothetical protein
MAKTNVNKTYAEEGLEDIQQYTAEAEENITSAPETGNTAGEDDMRVVSGVEPIVGYYQLKTPKKIGKTPVHIFQKGQTMKGTFEKTLEREVSFKEASTGRSKKFISKTYLVRHDSDGKLYGYSCGGLGNGFEKLELGSKVHVTYNGQQEGKDGNLYENFIILGNKRKLTA